MAEFLNPLRQKLEKHGPHLFRAFATFFGYIVWQTALKYFLLTLVTFFLLSEQPELQTINAAIAPYEFTSSALWAVLFVAFFRKLYPWVTTIPGDLLNFESLKKAFVSHLTLGLVVAVLFTLNLLFAGAYRYLGFFLDLDESASVALRFVSVIALFYSEEFLFRYKILGRLLEVFPAPYAVILVSILYTLNKAVQFDIGWTQGATLFLLSVVVSLQYMARKDFLAGAGYIIGLMLTFHVILGMPIMGNEFSRVIMIQYQDPMPGSAFSNDWWSYLLFGGRSGPLSSILFQLLLVTQITFLAFGRTLKRIYRFSLKKSLLNFRPTKLK